jgi:hypothetical protein
MKNLKIALILLAAVAMFCSCSKDEDETATANNLKLTVTSSIGNELSTANMDEVLPTDFTVTVNASEETNGLKSITGAVYGIWKGGISEDHQEGDLEEIFSAEDFNTLYVDGVFKKKDKTFSAEIPFSFTKANVETYASWCKAIRVTVTAVSNAKEPETLTRECNITLTVAEPEPETTAAEATGDFTWRRLGSTKEGIQEFGLNFFSRATANIRPIDETSKLYILSSSDYAIESLEALNEKLVSAQSEYRGVSVDASADYDDVIATVYDGKTYLMHITSCEINTPAAGTEIIIHGTYKRFANPTPAETK